MTHEVVIVGGGMVGAALAGALALDGTDVVVVERSPARDPSAWRGFDLRVSAINRASEYFFRRLGAWESMVELGTSPYREMRVWDAHGGRIHFDSADLGEPDLGHIIENRVILHGLEKALARQPSAKWYRPSRVLELVPTAEGHCLRLDSGEVEGRLVVGADGGRSRLRALANLPVIETDYGHEALVTTVRTVDGHQDTAWQHFLADGPLAFLPLADDHCAIVWSAPPGRVGELLEMDDEAFMGALDEAFDHRLGGIVWLGGRARFPLVGRHAPHYVKTGIALVGDAAHTIHPLAGQGANLGLLDAAVLAEVLHDARKRGRSPGDYLVLRRYERWRKGHNLLTQRLMLGLQQVFGGGETMAGLRGLGLRTLEHAGPARETIMRAAMGLLGERPRLTLPE